MTAGLFATSCDWFKKDEPSEPVAETVTVDSAIVTSADSNVQKMDSNIAVAETKAETKKEVKK